jgi:hypothetical protein
MILSYVSEFIKAGNSWQLSSAFPELSSAWGQLVGLWASPAQWLKPELQVAVGPLRGRSPA